MYLDYLLGTPQDYGIKNYKFNKDGTLDVFEDVKLVGLDLTELPFDFRNVYGKFDCSLNDITSLKGSPKKVTGDFNCNSNPLPICLPEEFNSWKPSGEK